MNNGGPAFPTDRTSHCNETGMSLRDYFAIHCRDQDIQNFRRGDGLTETVEARYRFADAMLAARTKEQV